MAYNNIISRTDAASLIPEEVVQEVLTAVTEQSAALNLFTRVPLSSGQARIPVVSALPMAYFVAGDTGLKQTTEVNWSDVFLNVEEIAAIVPIPEAVLDDTAFDVWGLVRPLLEEAIGRTLDAAIFFGTNKPASWPTAVNAAAIAAGNQVVQGTNPAAEGGVAGDLDDLFGKVEGDGYDVSGIVAKTAMRGLLRGARDTTGQKLLDVTNNSVEGVTVQYSMRGMWPAGVSQPQAFVGDFTQGVIGVRQDMTYKVLDQAVITDNGSPPLIVYNLPQQDMVALRIVARYAWAVPNPINWEQPTGASRYPFAVYTTPAT